MSETRLRIVLDTNVLLVSISSRSKYHWVFRDLVAGRFDLLISNEILAEYEEIIGEKFNPETAANVVRTLLLLASVEQVHPSYRWNLIVADPDDDKFVDCAVAANAHALVTEDRHFRILDEMEFPKINRLGIEAFEAFLHSRKVQ